MIYSIIYSQQVTQILRYVFSCKEGATIDLLVPSVGLECVLFQIYLKNNVKRQLPFVKNVALIPERALLLFLTVMLLYVGDY